jgi:glycosyltransferase involved in cell wall biosynthesis
MHIGVDATCWRFASATGRHTRGLLTALTQIDPDSRYTLFVDDPSLSGELSAIAEIRLIAASAPLQKTTIDNRRRSLRDSMAMSRAMAALGVDVLLFPSVFGYVPVFSRARKLLVLHDPASEPCPRSLLRRQVDAIVTATDYARQVIVDACGVDRQSVRVIGAGIDPVFRRLDRPRPTARLVSFGLTGKRRLIVAVGAFSPRAQLTRLIDAFGHLADRPDCTDADLVLVGSFEGDAFQRAYQQTRDRVRTLAVDRRVVVTGFLPDSDLVALLNLSTVLVVPATPAADGLPALEAAACGCPVIATVESPLPQLLGEGGLHFAPNQPAGLDDALSKVLTSRDRQDYMRRAGLSAASRLTWTAAAGNLLRLMRDAAVQ